MSINRLARPLVAALLLLSLLVPTALAGKPAPGTTTGTGRVFFPNPVAACRTRSLTDQKDADYPALQPAYRTVTLTNLDGSGYPRAATGPTSSARPATRRTRPTTPFSTTATTIGSSRSWPTTGSPQAQKYIQSLGFGSTLPADQQGVAGHPHQPVGHRQLVLLGQARRPALRQGRRGRRRGRRGDPARVRPRDEDSQMAAVGFGTSVEAGLDRRGLRGLLGGHRVERHRANAATPPASPTGTPCRTPASVPHCLRRVDLDLHYPEDLNGEVHHDGQIWSRALWDIHGALGHVKADTIILEAQFGFAPDTTMPAAAQATVRRCRSAVRPHRGQSGACGLPGPRHPAVGRNRFKASRSAAPSRRRQCRTTRRRPWCRVSLKKQGRRPPDFASRLGRPGPGADHAGLIVARRAYDH